MTSRPPNVPDSQVIDEFTKAMRDAGVNINGRIIADGVRHRYHVLGDRARSKNAWALLHIDAYPAGAFGDWKRFCGQTFRWKKGRTVPLTQEERRAFRDKAAARTEDQRKEREAEHAGAKDRAAQIYEVAEAIGPASHPYLLLKGVQPAPDMKIGKWYHVDEKTGQEFLISDQALLIPMRDSARTIHTLQAIFEDREPGHFRKQYLKYGVKEGRFFTIGKPRDNVVLISEGVATALSLAQCTAHAVVVAFDAGNLFAVAKEVRRVMPQALILLCADNDAWTKNPIDNPGKHYALRAAKEVGGFMAFPEFAQMETKLSDFNDLHVQEGEAAVRVCITRALESASSETQSTSHAEASSAAEEPKDDQTKGTSNPAMDALNPDVAHALRTYPPDVFFLTNDNFASVPVAAERIFSHLAGTGEIYRRGDAVAEIKENRVVVLTPTAFRSRLNKRGRKTMAFKVAQRGEVYPSEKHCSEDVSRVLLSASEVDLLPEIKLVVSNPLLVEIHGVLALAQPGYNRSCGVLVTGNASVRDVPISEAVPALLDLLGDFHFASDGDRARGIAGLIGPALRMGEFLSGNATVDMVEADESQAGKGTKCELTYAIYGEVPYPVVQREGGVGSFDESLSMALLSGAPFIALDNLRGILRSAMLEASITPVSPDKRVAVRVPNRGEIQVDVRRVTFQATSNGFTSTTDLANRVLVTRLVKQPVDYEYTQWGGLGLLEHAEKSSAYFLSCVQSVVRHWYAAGKPINPTRHTFKQWIGALDWIVQNIFAAAPLLDGHAGAAQRIANTGLSWLRTVANAVIKSDQADMELRAGDIRCLCERYACMPDDIKLDWDDGRAERAIGRIMAACFGESNLVLVDRIIVNRIERKPANNNWKPTKFYVFNRPAEEPPKPPKPPKS